MTIPSKNAPQPSHPIGKCCRCNEPRASLCCSAGVASAFGANQTREVEPLCLMCCDGSPHENPGRRLLGQGPRTISPPAAEPRKMLDAKVWHRSLGQALTGSASWGSAPDQIVKLAVDVAYAADRAVHAALIEDEVARRGARMPNDYINAGDPFLWPDTGEAFVAKRREGAAVWFDRTAPDGQLGEGFLLAHECSKLVPLPPRQKRARDFAAAAAEEDVEAVRAMAQTLRSDDPEDNDHLVFEVAHCLALGHFYLAIQLSAGLTNPRYAPFVAKAVEVAKSALARHRTVPQ